jgi:hypothetical protein
MSAASKQRFLFFCWAGDDLMDISGYPFETRAAQSITESVAHIPGLLTYARTRVETSFFFSSQE